jgi:gliding motility-associated lipoprotein GldH
MYLTSCTTLDVFEKNIAIPGYAWSKELKPQVTFTIADTVSRYNIFAVLRHTDAYRYKNIYMNVSLQGEGINSPPQRFDLKLAEDDKGWLGSGMDDIFEHRMPLFRAITFPKAGNYTFTLQNIMREEPLEHVMNVGIRLEKVK